MMEEKNDFLIGVRLRGVASYICCPYKSSITVVGKLETLVSSE